MSFVLRHGAAFAAILLAASLVGCGDRAPAGSLGLVPGGPDGPEGPETPETPDGSCGDGVVDADEACDDGALNGTPLHCADDCDGMTPAVCGNGVVEDGESCDDGEENGQPLACAADCSGITPSFCGNGVLEPGELCDEGEDNGMPLGCALDCAGTTPPECGNGVLEADELCDDGEDNGQPFFCATDCLGRADLAEGDGRDVIFIGDSWMNLVGFGELNLLPAGLDPGIYAAVPSGIQQTTTAAAGNPDYRHYGIAGTMLLDGAVPAQYAKAKNEDPDILTVVMTGGGNDILLDMPNFDGMPPIWEAWRIPGWLLGRINGSATVNCALWSGISLPQMDFLTVNPLVQTAIDVFMASPLSNDLDRTGGVCRAKIDRVAARYDALLDEFAADGVQDVVIVIYTRHTWIGPAPINYVWDTVGPLCDKERGDLRCHMVDADIANNGGPIGLLEGIHPNAQGYTMLGRLVYDRMVAEGVRR